MLDVGSEAGLLRTRGTLALIAGGGRTLGNQSIGSIWPSLLRWLLVIPSSVQLREMQAEGQREGHSRLRMRCLILGDVDTASAMEEREFNPERGIVNASQRTPNIPTYQPTQSVPHVFPPH